MKEEKTPEEAARSKRAHANSMIVMGAVTTVAALAAAWIAMSGRGDVPDWMFGGARAERAVSGEWTDRPSAVAFSGWGAEPFARAKKERKLVLLFMGPTFNAPTARMAAETFGDPSAAALASTRFVPVRVRSEDYPDLDRRYRAGGWPTTAALLPDGVPIAAGTAMTPEVFNRWAAAIADKAASHPEIVARIDAEAAERRRTADAGIPAAAAPLDALATSWDAPRRTFDREGPRFPRFERIAALSSLKAPGAHEWALEAARGALIFADPKDGGFRRAANPDGSPAALEMVALDQAASLDALCGLLPEAARKELSFLDKSFALKPDAWRGWLAGYSLKGVRPEGRARLWQSAELSRAVLSCAEASPAQKAFSRKALDRSWSEFGKAALARSPRLLLDDAVGMGGALLAAGRTKDAISVWRWIDANLSFGPSFLDRSATGILPPEMDRIADPRLNARVLVFMRGLLRDQPGEARRLGLIKREKDLYAWLSRRSAALDPAVWASLQLTPE